jgi:hypothetical protein
MVESLETPVLAAKKVVSKKTTAVKKPTVKKSI